MTELGPSDYLFLAAFAAFACVARLVWVRERAERAGLIRVVGEVVTLVLLALPVLMIIGALTGSLDRNGD